MVDKVIIWLDDKPHTVRAQIREAERRGFKVITCNKPHTVGNLLEEAVGRDAASQQSHASRRSILRHREEDFGKIAGLVIDAMLHGVNDMSVMNVPNADTNYGYEAGWVFLDRYLRQEKSRFASIPVLVLSGRRLDSAHAALLCEIVERGGAPVTFIEKFEGEWYTQWLDTIDDRPRIK